MFPKYKKVPHTWSSKAEALMTYNSSDDYLENLLACTVAVNLISLDPPSPKLRMSCSLDEDLRSLTEDIQVFFRRCDVEIIGPRLTLRQRAKGSEEGLKIAELTEENVRPTMHWLNTLTDKQREECFILVESEK